MAAKLSPSTDHVLHSARHESAHGSWEWVRRASHPALRHCVLDYEGYVETGTTFTRRRELPSDTTALIISLGRPVRIIDPRRDNVVELHDFVGPPWDTYAITELEGAWHGVQVNLTPVGAYRILGRPLHELSNRVVELEEVFGHLARQIQEQVRDASDWAQRFDVLDEVLTTRFDSGPQAAPGVVWAWQTLRRQGGQIPIAQLATELGCSRRHLIAQFREQLGLPPKLMARILRFRSTLRELERQTTPVRWPELALSCGYSDQAHMIREFRQFSGSAPTEFLRRCLPDGGGIIGD